MNRFKIVVLATVLLSQMAFAEQPELGVICEQTLAKRSLQDFKAAQGHLEKITIGQPEFIEQLMLAVLADGHISAEGLPGVGKTRTLVAFAEAIGLKTNRIQCDPELMPSQIIGHIAESAIGEREFVQGKIFTNILFIDEINRCNPRTQSVLLEAMEERQVTVLGVTHKLPDPFLVVSTQNPFDNEGTFPLPQAQLDRFLFRSLLAYPDVDVERAILRLKRQENLNGGQRASFSISAETLPFLRQQVRQMQVSAEAEDLMLWIAQISRNSEYRDSSLNLSILQGAGTRATLGLDVAARARATLFGREEVTAEDVEAVAKPVLRHRIGLKSAALSKSESVDDIIEKIIKLAKEQVAGR